MNHALAGDWVPYRLEQRDAWSCRWLSLAGRRCSEPFFAETVARCLCEAPNGNPRASLSSLDFLEYAAQGSAAIAPTAFIFHVSRCGSTLLAQLLGLDPRHVVLSEVPLFDQLLRLPANAEGAGKGGMLKAAIALQGRPRFGETRLFIKLDSWNIHHAPLLRTLYPDTPFILLARTPFEVLLSQRARRGTHAVPGLLDPALFGLHAEGIAQDDTDTYLGKVLAYYYTRFAELARDRRNLLLDYCQGPEDMMQRLTRHLGMAQDEAMLASIRARCRFHAKRPDSAFNEAPARKAAPACLETAETAYRLLGSASLHDGETGVLLRIAGR